MKALLARHLIYPIHERILGRKTFRYLRSMETSQWFAPTDISELQRIKLLALLRHARAVSPFYRRRLETEVRDHVPDASRTPGEILACLPLVTKDEIRQSLEQIAWHNAPGGLTVHSTGGSTGDPLTFYVDRRRQAYDQAARLRSHRWFGVDVGERELYLWGSPIEWTKTDRIKRWRDRMFNHRLISAFAMSPARMEQYLNEWDRFRPVSLYGYPSTIALLVGHAEASGRRPDTRHLKAVFVTGEVCYPHQRQAIGEYFGVPVANGYGSREAGFIAHECPQGKMHLCGENVIVEIIDAQGHVLPTGEPGEIVVTHLDGYGMPLIRYRTGDVGRIRSGRCACGRGLPLIEVVTGRTTDFIVLPDGTMKHALAIIYPMREMAGIRQFRVVQAPDRTVSVQVVADDARERITCDAVARRIRPVIGDDVGLHVEMVSNIHCPTSGKHHYVVSHALRPKSEESMKVATDA